jgi:hypothetical protein
MQNDAPDEREDTAALAGITKASTGMPEVLGKATMRRIKMAKPNENQEAKAAERRAANERYSPPLHATVTEGPGEPVGGSNKRSRGMRDTSLPNVAISLCIRSTATVLHETCLNPTYQDESDQIMYW